MKGRDQVRLTKCHWVNWNFVYPSKLNEYKAEEKIKKLNRRAMKCY